MDHVVNLPKGFAYIEFKNRAEAEKAQLHMDGAQIDGKVVRAKFTLPERKKVASPSKVVATTSRRDPSRPDDGAADGDRDGGKRPGDVLLGENNPLQLERDPLYHEEDLPDESKILHPHIVVELILPTDEVSPHLVGEGPHLLSEAVYHPLLGNTTGHHQGHLQEESVAVLFVGDLLHLDDILQDVLKVLQEGLLLVAVALQLGDRLVRHHVHPLLEGQ